MRIVLVNSRVSRNTRYMIGKVRERIQVCPMVTEPIMEALDNIAKQCLETIDELEDISRSNSNHVVKSAAAAAAAGGTPTCPAPATPPTVAANNNSNIENSLNNKYVQKSFAALEVSVLAS